MYNKKIGKGFRYRVIKIPLTIAEVIGIIPSFNPVPTSAVDFRRLSAHPSPLVLLLCSRVSNSNLCALAASASRPCLSQLAIHFLLCEFVCFWALLPVLSSTEQDQ
ncbi:hypothetical protein K1719_039139 [Acacia pycnantha]|nr:hypothetical protein K1719_039139 [Acacia pycnantha]